MLLPALAPPTGAWFLERHERSISPTPRSRRQLPARRSILEARVRANLLTMVDLSLASLAACETCS